MKKKRRNRIVQCAYCREMFPEKETTEDHVPPQGMFGKKVSRPKNMRLIKVNACRPCHKSTSKGDDALKQMIGSSGPLTSEANIVLWELSDRAVIPSYWNKQLKKSFLETERKIPISMSNRGVDWRVPLTDELWAEVESSVRRTCIGLIFRRSPEIDHRKYSFNVIPQIQPLDEAIAALGPFPHEETTGGRYRFYAGWGLTPGFPNWGGMLLSFYGGFTFFVIITTKEGDDSSAQNSGVSS